MKISSPVRPADHPDYRLDCQEAIDLAVRDLVDTVIQAGWEPLTVYAALKSVAIYQRLAYLEDPDPAVEAIDASGA